MARKGSKSTAKTTAKTTSKTAVKPQSLKANDQHPEPAREASPVFRADMGEGLPDQTDTLNPKRAK